MATGRIEGWPALMQADTAAAYLDCSPRKLAELQRQGKVIPVDSDMGKRYTREELDRYIASLGEWQSA